MPVLSPHRSNSSSLSGSYRTAYNSSGLGSYSNAYHPRIKTYSEHYSTRSYIDGDGHRVLSRFNFNFVIITIINISFFLCFYFALKLQQMSKFS